MRASVFQDMPASGSRVPFPSQEQRALIARWVEGGAPLRTDGGADAGPPDADLQDGGGADGGA